MKKNNLLEKNHNLWNYKNQISTSSDKIAILVEILRNASNDEEIKSKNLLIPDNCEKLGFVQGDFNLSTVLHFLADMLEE